MAVELLIRAENKENMYIFSFHCWQTRVDKWNVSVEHGKVFICENTKYSGVCHMFTTGKPHGGVSKPRRSGNRLLTWKSHVLRAVHVRACMAASFPHHKGNSLIPTLLHSGYSMYSSVRFSKALTVEHGKN